MNQDDAKIRGYAAGSAFSDHPPADEQVREIEARAKGIKGEFVGCFVEQNQGPEDPFTERPEFQKALSTIRANDHLVVYSLAIIDANPHRLDDALRLLVDRRVHVHTLAEEGGEQLDLDPRQVRVLSVVWRLFRRMRVAYIAATTRRALRLKKAIGQVHHRYSPYGKKRVRRKAGGRVIKCDLWDERQCAIIREMRRRRMAGETLEVVAQDFHQRRLKMPDGREWVPKCRWRFNTSAIPRALAYYEDVLARGLDLGDPYA